MQASSAESVCLQIGFRLSRIQIVSEDCQGHHWDSSTYQIGMRCIRKWPPDVVQPTGVYTECHAPGGIMLMVGSEHKDAHKVIPLTGFDQVPTTLQILRIHLEYPLNLGAVYHRA